MRRNVARRGEKAAPHREAAAGKRIEHPHFDVRVLAQVHEVPILTGGIEIIDQDRTRTPRSAARRT
jgi:hypothetical protein